jgi:protein-S-isoprenylcysteine O-methyltransferase Ste14
MYHSWSTLVIGCILGAYWARVVRMAYKARRRTATRRGVGLAVLGANFVPPEPLGRALRTVWIPIVLAWIALPFVGFAVDRPPRWLHPAWAVPAVAWTAVIVAAGAFGATWVCWKQMGRNWRMGIDPAERTTLVLGGAFRYVRHPIYALSCVLMLATLAAVPNVAMLIVAILHIALLRWEAGREEMHLMALHGQTYVDYASRTGRFVPAIWRRSVH